MFQEIDVCLIAFMQIKIAVIIYICVWSEGKKNFFSKDLNFRGMEGGDKFYSFLCHKNY